MASIRQNSLDKPSGNLSNGDEYRWAFRAHVFELLLIGYEKLPSRALSSWDEERITGDLAKQIEAYMDDSNAADWVAYYHFSEETPVHSEKKGKDRRRLDFRFECSRIRPRLKFAFEAKRLCSGSNPVGKYVGPDGMGCFINGHYAQGEDEAGMLGYVQSDSIQLWEEKISQKIKDTDSLHVRANGAWGKVYAPEPLDRCYISEHDRNSPGRPIAIYHLLLSFC